MAKTMYYHTNPTCMPCKQLKPMAKKEAEAAGYVFEEVNIDEEAPKVAGIMAVPTIWIVDDEGNDHVVGPNQVRKSHLRALLND